MPRRSAILTASLGAGAGYWIERLVSTGGIEAVLVQATPPRPAPLEFLKNIRHITARRRLLASPDWQAWRSAFPDLDPQHLLAHRARLAIRRAARSTPVAFADINSA